MLNKNTPASVAKVHWPLAWRNSSGAHGLSQEAGSVVVAILRV